MKKTAGLKKQTAGNNEYLANLKKTVSAGLFRNYSKSYNREYLDCGDLNFAQTYVEEMIKIRNVRLSSDKDPDDKADNLFDSRKEELVEKEEARLDEEIFQDLMPESVEPVEPTPEPVEPTPEPVEPTPEPVEKSILSTTLPSCIDEEEVDEEAIEESELAAKDLKQYLLEEAKKVETETTEDSTEVTTEVLPPANPLKLKNKGRLTRGEITKATKKSSENHVYLKDEKPIASWTNVRMTNMMLENLKNDGTLVYSANMDAWIHPKHSADNFRGTVLETPSVDAPSSTEDFKQALLDGTIADMVKEVVVGETISGTDTLVNVLLPLMSTHEGIEKFYCIYLDAKNRTIKIEAEFSGSITSCGVYPREIIKKCLEYSAVSLIVAHNHPSGSSDPSSEDYEITNRLVFATRSMGISLHDHIVIGNKKDWNSMASNDFISKFNTVYDTAIKNF